MIYVMVATSETGEFHPFDAHQYVVDEASDIGRALRKIERQIRAARGVTDPDETPTAVTVFIDGPPPDARLKAAYEEGYARGRRER